MHSPQNKTRAAHEKGGETEYRFFEALQCVLWKQPFWYKGYRRANREEDRRGVDAFVEIDAGIVPVQIKSSDISRKKHIEHYGNEHVIIVISEHMTAQMIRSRLMNLLYYKRGELFRKQKETSCRRARR